MIAYRIAAILTFLTLVQLIAGWKRYEKRVLNCPNANATSCTMEIGRNVTETVNCRHEPIPEVERTKLNKNASHRIACPIGCKIHIVQQAHSLNRKCLSLSTFGKYFDADAQNWYIWFCEPCQSVFSTNCEFDTN